jgi:hypothetical protein
MSKGHDGADKHPEKHKDQQKEPHKEHADGDKKHGEAKPKAHTPMPGGCFSWGCKTQASRFNFCSEHYEHFKFGLIKKTGEPVPDFEKKFEHFQAHKAKKAAQKVA